MRERERAREAKAKHVLEFATGLPKVPGLRSVCPPMLHGPFSQLHSQGRHVDGRVVFSRQNHLSLTVLMYHHLLHRCKLTPASCRWGTEKRGAGHSIPILFETVQKVAKKVAKKVATKIHMYSSVQISRTGNAEHVAVLLKQN